MSEARPAVLQDVADVLEGAGYDLERRTLAKSDAIVASSPYALVACIAVNGWDHLVEFVADSQADLTRLAGGAPSARNWDLYVVVLVDRADLDAERRTVIKRLESDTRYARKFVYAGVAKSDLDTALRPLLPLRPAAEFAVPDPLVELRAELIKGGVDKNVVDTALGSFDSEERVEVA